MPIESPKQGARGTPERQLVLFGVGSVVYGLPIERIPDTIANTVQLIVDQLKTKARTTR